MSRARPPAPREASCPHCGHGLSWITSTKLACRACGYGESCCDGGKEPLATTGEKSPGVGGETPSTDC